MFNSREKKYKDNWYLIHHDMGVNVNIGGQCFLILNQYGKGILNN